MNLPENSGFAIRHATYTPTPVSRGFGIMEVSERKTKASKIQTRRYLVHDLGMVPDKLGRAFRVKKSRDVHVKGQEDFYNVLLSVFGPTKHVCDCKGFESHGHCVHVEGLTALVADGSIPSAEYT